MDISKKSITSKEVIEAIQVLRDYPENKYCNMYWNYHNTIQGHEGVAIGTFTLEGTQEVAVLAMNGDRSWDKSTIAIGWEMPIKTLVQHLKNKMNYPENPES